MATIRWGMIGCGAVAEVKSGPGFYKADNSKLLAVTSADPALTKSFAERHGVPKAYETSEQLVADAKVQVEPKVRALDQAMSKRLGIVAPASAASGASPASGPK